MLHAKLAADLLPISVLPVNPHELFTTKFVTFLKLQVI